MKKILITGVAGFIGYHLSEKLLENNYHIIGIDNLNDYYDPNLKKARLDNLNEISNFEFHKIDFIKNKELKPILEKYEQNHRQDIPTAYYRNGSIYLVRTKAFLSSRSLMVKPTMSFEMPENILLNIDSPRDLMIAEILIKSWKDGLL